MKRSEAVEGMFGYMLTLQTFSVVSVHELKKEITKLLNFIEKDIKMLPPGERYTVHGVVTHLHNEWDKEDAI